MAVGIGPNVLVARLATRQAKPNGQHRVPRSCVMNFLADLPVERLHGVGYRTAEKLTELGVTTVRQLRALSKEMLQRQLGPKQGQVRVRNRTTPAEGHKEAAGYWAVFKPIQEIPSHCPIKYNIIGPDAVALCARC